MQYFAKVDANGIVTEVQSVDKQTLLDDAVRYDGGIKDSLDKTANKAKWVETDIDGKFRKNYAGIGYSYDENLDIFIPPSPFPSWSFIKSTQEWQAPVKYPTDGKDYTWNEDTIAWDIYVPPV